MAGCFRFDWNVPRGAPNVWPLESCVAEFRKEMEPAEFDIDSGSGGYARADLVHKFEMCGFSPRSHSCLTRSLPYRH